MTGSLGIGSRITLKTGMKLAFTPVFVFILMNGKSVKLPVLIISTSFIFPKESQLYDNCVPLDGSITNSSTPHS